MDELQEIGAQLAQDHRNDGGCLGILARALLAAHEKIKELKNAGVPTNLACPECGTEHVDEGEWATRPHRKHLCIKCGNTWKPYPVATFGVHGALIGAHEKIATR